MNTNNQSTYPSYDTYTCIFIHLQYVSVNASIYLSIYSIIIIITSPTNGIANENTRSLHFFFYELYDQGGPVLEVIDLIHLILLGIRLITAEHADG